MLVYDVLVQRTNNSLRTRQSTRLEKTFCIAILYELFGLEVILELNPVFRREKSVSMIVNACDEINMVSN